LCRPGAPTEAGRWVVFRIPLRGQGYHSSPCPLCSDSEACILHPAPARLPSPLRVLVTQSFFVVSMRGRPPCVLVAGTTGRCHGRQGERYHPTAHRVPFTPHLQAPARPPPWSSTRHPPHPCSPCCPPWSQMRPSRRPTRSDRVRGAQRWVGRMKGHRNSKTQGRRNGS
jgi:hypothetical protein